MWVRGDDYVVKITDEHGELIKILELFSSFSIVFNFNDVSSWELRGAYEDLGDITWGNYVQFFRNDELVLAGKVESFDRDFSATVDELAITGKDNCVLLSYRRVLPDPEEDVVVDETFTYATAFDTRTGSQETVMKEYVYYNLGAGALVFRQDPNVTIETDQARGNTTNGIARFDILLELLQELAIPTELGGDELGFRFAGENGFEFQVYEPRDLSSTVIFAIERGTMLSYRYSTTAPTGNYIFAGGSGEDELRLFYSLGDEDSMVRYGLRELFTDASHTESATELYPEVVKELFENADKTLVEVEPAPLDNLKFWDDYRVGDIVSCIMDGVEVKDIIRSVEFEITEEGAVTVVPAIGRSEAYFSAVARIWDRVRKTESRTDYLGRII